MIMIGKNILHYKIMEKLGAGGMGVVYKAVDLKLDRIVALKFLPTSYSFDEDIKKRFVHEAKAVSKLQHNNICTIHEINETGDGQLFICIDYYEGESLKEKLKKGKLELNEALDITLQICEGLKKAHEKNIIHRDIKPANIFITKDGIVKILDFGLAKMKGQSHLTKFESTIGTTAYMSPEQAKGDEVDQQTDIWSLGVVFYEMVSGKLPFKGEYDQAIIYSILNKTPDELDAPKKIKNFVSKCLQKKVVNRYLSIDEILAEFNLTSGSSLKTGKVSNKERLLNKASGNKSKIALVVTLIILFSALVWFIFNNLINSGSKPEPKQVAVLPFINIGNDPGSKAFCDGLVETLTSQLTQLPQFNTSIQVIPSSEIHARHIKSAKQAAQIFGADLAVTGSIQKYSDKIRLILNLVDTKSLRQISSTSSDYTLSNVYNFQDDVVTKLSHILAVNLEPEEIKNINRGGTENIDAYILYTQGKGYLQDYWSVNNINGAIKLFHEALRKDPKYTLAFAGLAEAYIKKFKYEKNTSYLDSASIYNENAKNLNDNLPFVHIASGMIFNEKGEFEKSAAEFKKVIEEDKYNFDGYNGLAIAYQSLNLDKKAEQTYMQSISLRPAYWVGYNKLGIFYYSHGKFNKALEQFQKVVELTPDNTFGLNNLGAVNMYLGNWAKAKTAFQHVIKLQSDYSAYSNLGSIYFFNDEDFKSAAGMYRKALELDSSNYLMWGNIASAYYQIPGDKDKSKYYFEHAIALAEKELKLNPRNPSTLSSLASYYSMLGEKDKSIKYLNEALELSPGDVDVLDKGIVVNETLGRRNEALKLTREILQKGFPISKLEKSPDLKDMIKDKRFEVIKKEFSNLSPTKN
jgi:serine/threonine protein kinase/tetratricopeptide (TPR) repeat protein